jgi:diguanylate cyclase (GGDEF)-like protein
MSSDQAGGPLFDGGLSSAHDPLAAAAASLTADAEAQGTEWTLVVVVRPGARDYRVVAEDGRNGALRAAVSVMVASDNTRLWSDAATDEVVERSVASLPEVVRAAAEGAGVTTAHVGVVRKDAEVGAVALWFGTERGTADVGTRRDTLRVLAAAADRYVELAAEKRAAAADRPESEEPDADDDVISLPTGSDDPDVDPLTGLASRLRFDQALDDFEGDEATLLLIDLDHFAAINEEYGNDAGDRVLQETARRLASLCRGTDLVARLDADAFAVLLQAADRNTGLQICKRLLGAIGEPLPPDIGPESVSATLAFAHEFGLVDMDELYESADDAVTSGKRSGRGRIVIAS